MSKYKEVMEKVAKIQDATKLVGKYKLLCELIEPGKSEFKPKEGELLICPLPIKPIERKIKMAEDHVPGLEDFLGIHPWLAIVMESNHNGWKAGDLIGCNPELLSKQSQTVIVKSAVAVIIPSYVVTGTYESI